MAQVLGRATIRVDGQAYQTKPGASVQLGGTMRTPVSTHFGTNFAEQHSPAVVTLTIDLVRGLSLQALRDATDVVIQFEADTGQTYVVREAFLSNEPTVTDGEGGAIELQFTGQPAEEVLA